MYIYTEEKQATKTKYFIADANYYAESWLNGNRSHVIAHLVYFSNDDNAIFYNAILKQFVNDSETLYYLLSKVTEETGKAFNESRL